METGVKTENVPLKKTYNGAPRRNILVPLYGSAFVTLLSWSLVIASFFPNICQKVYDLVQRDLEMARYPFAFTGVLFLFFFIFCVIGWRKAER